MMFDWLCRYIPLAAKTLTYFEFMQLIAGLLGIAVAGYFAWKLVKVTKLSANISINLAKEQIGRVARENTVNLLRFFSDNIINTCPDNHYIGPTSKHFEALQFVEDKLNNNKKDRIKFVNNLEVFASWACLCIDNNQVEIEYLYKIGLTFILFVNQFFDVICFSRFNDSLTYYPSIIDLYNLWEDNVVLKSLEQNDFMELQGYYQNYAYKIYSNKEISVLQKNQVIIPLVVYNEKTREGISGWRLEFRSEQKTNAILSVRGYEQVNKDTSDIKLQDNIVPLSDEFKTIISNSSGTIFICYDFRESCSGEIDDALFIKSKLKGEWIADEFHIVIKPENDNIIIRINTQNNDRMQFAGKQKKNCS